MNNLIEDKGIEGFKDWKIREGIPNIAILIS